MDDQDYTALAAELERLAEEQQGLDLRDPAVLAAHEQKLVSLRQRISATTTVRRSTTKPNVSGGANSQ